MWSPALTACVLAGIVGRQVFTAAESRHALEPDFECPKDDDICTPNPHAHHMGCRSTCTFSVREDIVENRNPRLIYQYSCLCPSKLCTERGDYRCTQVRKDIPVYFNEDFKTKTFMSVNTSCVCATSQSTPANNCCDRIADREEQQSEHGQFLQCLNAATRIIHECAAESCH